MKSEFTPLESILRDVEVSNKRVMELSQRLASIKKELDQVRREIAALPNSASDTLLSH